MIEQDEVMQVFEAPATEPMVDIVPGNKTSDQLPLVLNQAEKSEVDLHQTSPTSDSQYFEEVYDYYTTDKAWHLCDPNAEKVLKALRNAGVKIDVVSNSDTRLRPPLRALNCDDWFDVVLVSAEVAAEKLNPTIFLKSCELLDVKPEYVVHVGDDRRNDIWGARDVGCDEANSFFKRVLDGGVCLIDSYSEISSCIFRFSQS